MVYDHAPAYRDAVLEGLMIARCTVLSKAAKPQIANECKFNKAVPCDTALS
jgi:hypothetical protein